MLLKSPEAQTYFLSEGTADHKAYSLEWAPPRDQLQRPYYLQRIEPLPAVMREITSIKITGPCTFEISSFGLQRGTFGGVHIAWGSMSLTGRDTLIVATRDAAGTERLTVDVADKKQSRD